MTNFEKYVDKIKEMLTTRSIGFNCVISELRGADKCPNNWCKECALKNADWLMQEYSKDCTDCKWYRKIEGENKYYACLKEGHVMSAGDENEACGFREEK